jgi:hypothetical protein
MVPAEFEKKEIRYSLPEGLHFFSFYLYFVWWYYPCGQVRQTVETGCAATGQGIGNRQPIAY